MGTVIIDLDLGGWSHVDRCCSLASWPSLLSELQISQRPQRKTCGCLLIYNNSDLQFQHKDYTNRQASKTNEASSVTHLNCQQCNHDQHKCNHQRKGCTGSQGLDITLCSSQSKDGREGGRKKGGKEGQMMDGQRGRRADKSITRTKSINRAKD